jgi:hypothetical protein
MRYALRMAKKRKFKWDRKPCGCIRTKLSVGRVVIRCTRHRGKPAKGRILAYWDEGQVRLEP